MSSAKVCDTKINSFSTDSTIGIPVPAVYLYTGTDPSLVISRNVFDVKPTPCEENIEYSCVCIACPVDLCQYTTDAFTDAFMDPVTGVFTFSSTDRIGVPPGDYVI